MKLIHLSDTHVGRADNHLRLQKLLQDIASLGQPQDFVIIHTGDLCDQGIESEIRQSRALLDPMLAQGLAHSAGPRQPRLRQCLANQPGASAAF